MPRSTHTHRVTFAGLVERLEAAGLVVGVERRDDAHAITVVDLDSSRSIRLPVSGSFDGTAHLLVLSARLREAVGMTASSRSGKGAAQTSVSGRWPEFIALWPELDRRGCAT